MTQTKKIIGELTYEDAFDELVTIVNTLEAEEQALETALNLFERGQLLAKRCAELLEQADVRIRQLSPEELDSAVSGESDLSLDES